MEDFYTQFMAVKAAFDREAYEEALAILQKWPLAQLTNAQCLIYEDVMFTVLEKLGRLPEALEHARRGLSVPVEATDLRHQKRALCSNWLLYLHYLPDVTDAQMFAAHQRYAGLFPGVRPFSWGAARAARAGKKKLRIGYISPNFYEHIVTNFSVQLYAQYDRSRYEVILYQTGGQQNEVTDWLNGMVNGWRDLRKLTPKEAAARIAADEVDILVDLAGHTEGGHTLEIMAWKPAPVQVSGIGYFDTTGLPQMDYFLGDRYCDPPLQDRNFTEKILRLPHCHFCFTPKETVQQAKTTYQLHTPVVFGSFNNFRKLTPQQLAVWREIVRRVPGSHLLLRHTQNEPARLAYVQQLVDALDFPAGSVTVEPGIWHYLDHYQDVDIVLDTYPYPGGGTTCEALYMGVPVVSRYGTRHGSRFGLSLLTNVGLGELAAGTDEDYIRVAVALAQDPQLIVALHRQLRTLMQNSPLMDARGYVRGVEAAYERIWRRWLRGRD